nr:MAG TPA: hypothetical protein [Caudoviricetes sp.]
MRNIAPQWLICDRFLIGYFLAINMRWNNK